MLHCATKFLTRIYVLFSVYSVIKIQPKGKKNVSATVGGLEYAREYLSGFLVRNFTLFQF